MNLRMTTSINERVVIIVVFQQSMVFLAMIRFGLIFTEDRIFVETAEN